MRGLSLPSSLGPRFADTRLAGNRAPASARLLAACVLALSGCATTVPGLAPGQSFPVFFGNAVTLPDREGLSVIDSAVAWARRYPLESVVVTGYADPRASDAQAERLSRQRADTVAAELERRGVAPDRIRRAIGTEPVASISGLPNRRVDIAVSMAR